MASCPFLFSQDILKEWIEIPCENLESIHNDANYTQIWKGETESNQYVCSSNKDDNGNESMKLYKFTANGEKATLTEIDKNLPIYLSDEEKPYLENEKCIFRPYALDDELVISKINKGENPITYQSDIDVFYSSKFHCFFMNNTHYLLIYSKKILYQLKLTDNNKSITIDTTYDINAFQAYNYILILKDTFYYLSKSGFCAVKISANGVDSELISNVTVTDAKSLLVTDKKDKIWIMNQTDGVIEYNTKTQEAKKIAEFPDLSKTINMEKVCFYSENYLYLMINEAVYSLDVTPDEPDNPDDPDDPDNPVNAPDQSGHQCGCLGLEFIFAIAGLFIFRLYRKH